jgi:hypothetical protein
MWVNKELFQRILDDNKRQADEIVLRIALWKESAGRCTELHIQKAKDDLTIDWLRHRVNALEKQNTILMGKATGLHFPVPEIVPSRPGTMAGTPDFDHLPSFEDVGDEEAERLGITHDLEGNLQYKN